MLKAIHISLYPANLQHIVALKIKNSNILFFFNIYCLTYSETYCIFIYMATRIDPYQYFAHPQSPGQRQYEALRAFYIDGLPARVVADHFGYTVASFNALRQIFKTGKLSLLFVNTFDPLYANKSDPSVSLLKFVF